MKKRLLSLLLMVVMAVALIPLTVSAENSVSTKAKVVSGVSFRTKPSTSSTLLRYLKTGETVTVESQLNPYWYFVKDQQGVGGYVSTSEKYITIVSNAKVISSVNFRTAPSTQGARIRLLPAGEELLILEKVNGYWYRAEDLNGVVGYVSTGSKYLDTNFSVVPIVLPLDEKIEAFIAEGMKYWGTPYEFGSDRFDTATFDCSDFVQQSFWNVTRTVLPGDSRSQGDYVKAKGSVTTDWHNLKRGDLMFFMSYEGSRASDYAGIDKSNETITHVGIYLGDGTMLHTYSPESGGVRIDAMAGKAWEHRFLFGGSFTE